ncbi:Predicted arabinose efflux permease, MFS family [Pseudacidovorax sp. RU35E]|nr:Predicted arabinose efflux permease, MFS family [Pseudacidovorax sp. RU35E]
MNGAGQGGTRSESAQAWRAALGCMVALAVAMGLGRFAFTPMLPVMLGEGQVDLQAGGLLASLNYLGYFVGALSSAWVRAPARTLVRGGLVATAVLLVGMGLLHGFAAWATLRAAAGLASAWVFVFASGWGARRLAEAHAPGLGGVIYAGPGLGIALTGFLGGPAGRWGASTAWCVYGVLALALTALVWRIFDDGREGMPAAAAVSPMPPAAAGVGPEAAWLVGLYGLAGFGYIITATFLPVIARQALPGSTWPDLFWPLFGLAVVPGVLIGGRAPQHWDNRLLLAGGYVMQAIGVLLSVAWPTITGFAVGSMLLGLPFTAITLFAVREARRLRGNAAAGLIGYATASYGLGQIVGPLFAAPVAQRWGGFAPALWVAAVALMLGAILFVVVWRRTASRPSGG